jgi:hypothetical protein
VVDLSDERIKEHIAPSKVNALEILSKIKTIEFSKKKMKLPEANKKCGFSAQNLQEVFPEMVAAGPDGMLGIDKAGLVPVLVKAINELSEQVKELQKRVDNSNKSEQ